MVKYVDIANYFLDLLNSLSFDVEHNFEWKIRCIKQVQSFVLVERLKVCKYGFIAMCFRFLNSLLT